MSDFVGFDPVQVRRSLLGHEAPKSRLWRMLQTPRQNAEIAARRYLGSVRPVLIDLIWKDRFHGFIPEAVSSILYRYGFYERVTSLFLLSHLKPGDTFVDIGSHFGYFTLLASRICGDNGRVIAVEAMPETFAQLQRNVAVNNLSNVSALNHAASDVRRTLSFQDYGIVASSLNTAHKPRGDVSAASARTIMVEAIPVDELLLGHDIPPIKVVKIDAESSEYEILVGMRQIIARHKPTIITEIGGGGEDEDARIARMVSLLEGFGYRPHHYDGQQLRPLAITPGLAYVNAIFMAESGHATEI